MDIRLQAAFEATVEELAVRPDVTGIIFFGSAQRGIAGPSSDLDFYVVVSGDIYWRVNRLCLGVEVELFHNPAGKLRQRLEAGDPVAIHALATGAVLLDRTGDVAALVERARELWAAGPRPLSEWEQVTWRYRLSDLAKDLEDGLAAGGDPTTLQHLSGCLGDLALQADCALNGRWAEKPKRLLAQVKATSPALTPLILACFNASPACGWDERAKAALALADAVLAPFGGRISEFESPRGQDPAQRGLNKT